MTVLPTWSTNPVPCDVPEVQADVVGSCDLPLTRAVVSYRPVHEVGRRGDGLEDIGMALVLDGTFASAAGAVDLGSGRPKELDLTSELVILDWALEGSVSYVQGLLRKGGGSPSIKEGEGGREVAAYCFRMAVGVLRRLGYTPLTRPVLLRVGFRDVCRDLDMHERTAVRILCGGGEMARASLDAHANTLVVSTNLRSADRRLEDGLLGAFPGRDVRLRLPLGNEQGLVYEVRFPLPLTFQELRNLVREVREGLAYLSARFEPQRFLPVKEVISALGARDTLAWVFPEGPSSEGHARPLQRAALPPLGLVH